MLSEKDLQGYRLAIEEAVVGVGRDDVGVGEVKEVREGMIEVTFSRGTHTSTAEIPVDQLTDHEHVRKAVNTAILSLSKEVAQEALHKAG